jgi:hypothetical protein
MKRNLVLTALLGLLMTGAAAFAMPHGGGPFGVEKLKAFSELPADKQKLIVDTLTSLNNAIAELAPQLTQSEREILAQLGPGGHHGHKKH